MTKYDTAIAQPHPSMIGKKVFLANDKYPIDIEGIVEDAWSAGSEAVKVNGAYYHTEDGWNVHLEDTRPEKPATGYWKNYRGHPFEAVNIGLNQWNIGHPWVELVPIEQASDREREDIQRETKREMIIYLRRRNVPTGYIDIAQQFDPEAPRIPAP